MNSKKLTRGLTAAATLSMLAACGPAPTTGETPTPSSSPVESTSPAPTETPDPAETAIPEPTATPGPVETASPVPTATPGPVETASPVPTATPDPNATTAPSPTALPSAQEDISIVEKTTFNGKVYDDTNAPLDGVTIKVKSLNGSVPYEAETTTAGGTYAFNNAPAGVQIEIMATRQGYTTRRRVEVLKSNKQGDPNANRYDFGTDGGDGNNFGVQYNALSDKPEVTMVTPGRNVAGVDPATSFVMKFSEPMDRKTVIDNFEVRAYTTETFSIDSSTTLTGSGLITTPAGGDRVWDKAAFNASWNSDDTEVTLSFKEERILPTDKDSDKTPDYQVSFLRQDNQLKDKSGITRASEYFKLTDGGFEESYKFSINTDEQKPTLSSLVAQTAENSGANSDGDAIKIRYSERMIHYTLSPTIAGGKNGVTSQAAGANNGVSAESAAMNYKVTVIRSGETQLNQTTWANLGGKAIFDTNDPTHKTVILLPPANNIGVSVGDDNIRGKNINGTIFYVDGTSKSFTQAIGTGPNSYDQLEEAFYDALGYSRMGVHVSRVNDANTIGNIDAGDSYGLELLTGFGLREFVGPAISSVMIEPTGAFGPDALNRAFILYPDVLATARTDIYKPGDNVIVKADTTILDPAGNSVDSSGNDASANAS